MKDSTKIVISILLLIIGAVFMVILPVFFIDISYDFNFSAVGMFIIVIGAITLFRTYEKMVFKIKESTGIVISILILTIGVIIFELTFVLRGELKTYFNLPIVGILLIVFSIGILLFTVFRDAPGYGANSRGRW